MRQKSYTLHRAAKTFGCSVEELEQAIADGSLACYEMLDMKFVREDDLDDWLTNGSIEADPDMEITLLSAASIAGVPPKHLMIDVVLKKINARTRNRHWTRWMISFRNLMRWRDEMKAKGMKFDD